MCYALLRSWPSGDSSRDAFVVQWDFAQVDVLWINCEVITKHLQRVIALRLFSSYLFSFFPFFKKGTKKMVTTLSSNYSSFRETCLICLLSSVLCQVGFDQMLSCRHSIVSIQSELVTSELWSVIWSRSHCSSSFLFIDFYSDFHFCPGLSLRAS